MALTTIHLSDPIPQIVQKSNQISTHVGDVTTLFSGDSNVVDGINSLRDLLSPFDDSSEILAIGREAVNVVSSGDFGSLNYDSATGIFTYVAPTTSQFRSIFNSSNVISYNENNGEFAFIPNALDGASLIDSSFTSVKFKDLITLYIKNSAGSVLKTIYSPGA